MSRILTLACCCVLAACSESGHTISFEPQPLAVPTKVPGKGPRISGNDEMGVFLTWMEADENSTALMYSSYRNETWSDAKRIVEVEAMFVNWADMPSVVPLGGGQLAAHWLQKSADLTYAYDVMYTQSADDGVSWSEPMRPHTDGTPTEHGFVSMFADGDGTGLIWLDGRKMVNESTDDPIASGMTLRAASISPGRMLHREQLIDELTCDCCQTDVAIAASGPVAVYRDRSINEIRDIYVTRLINGQWRPGRRIAADQWEIQGCPVNGPSIVADDATVAVAWFTAAEKRPVVKISWSDDSGATFSAPIEVIDGGVLGRVGVVLLDDGAAAVSWLQAGENVGREVRIRKVGANGDLGPTHTISDAAGSFAVPQLARSGNDLILVWTDSGDSAGRISSARVPIAGL